MTILTSGDQRRFDKEMKMEMKSPVWCLDDKPPDTPYVKLYIKAKKKERRYLESDLLREKTFTIFGLTITFRLKAKRREKGG